jgi:glucokinase
MNIFNDYSRSEKKINFSKYVLGIDVGGTNTKLGIAGINNLNQNLLFSFSYKTQSLNSLIPAINEILSFSHKEYNIKINSICIAVAGIILSQDYVKLTNANLDINLKEIINKTNVKSVILINDFQSIGYGINILDHKNKECVYTIRSEKPANKNIKINSKAVIGAGTGLGKSILFYDKKINYYIPLSSEGGHSDLPIINSFESDLLEYIKKVRNIKQPVTYEEVLSGRGLEIIYSFLEKYDNFDESKYSEKIKKSKDKASIISKYRKYDKLCSKTFSIFSKFFGRCAKNFALDTFSSGGIYITGGIAVKNKEIFKTKVFRSECENTYRRDEILKNIPIY